MGGGVNSTALPAMGRVRRLVIFAWMPKPIAHGWQTRSGKFLNSSIDCSYKLPSLDDGYRHPCRYDEVLGNLANHGVQGLPISWSARLANQLECKACLALTCPRKASLALQILSVNNFYIPCKLLDLDTLRLCFYLIEFWHKLDPNGMPILLNRKTDEDD